MAQLVPAQRVARPGLAVTAFYTFLTAWESAEAFRRYMRSEAHAVSHGREPGEIMARTTVRHEAFEPIRTELLTLGFPSLSISEVKGSGRQKGITRSPARPPRT